MSALDRRLPLVHSRVFQVLPNSGIVSKVSADVLAALRLVASRCPRLRSACYWAGTACISLEELDHRSSYDLDFHTRRALLDVRPLLAELQQAFPGAVDVVQAPDEFGSGFQVVLRVPGTSGVAVEVLSNYEDVAEGDLQPAASVEGLDRVTLVRYLEDKVQCLAERAEARDLVDVRAILTRRPDLLPLAKRLVALQDAVLLTQRLLKWTDEAVKKDLAAYPDVDPQSAVAARDQLLAWIKA